MTNNVSSMIDDARKQSAAVQALTGLTTQQQLDLLKAENARLKGGTSTVASPTVATVSGKAANGRTAADLPKGAKVAATDLVLPTSTFAGNYPPTAEPEDKLILDAIHSLKDYKVKAGDVYYDVPAVFGGALFSYFHSHMIPGYGNMSKADREIMKQRCNAKIQPYLDSAKARGIITMTCAGKGFKAMWFDGREKAAKDYTRTETAVKAEVSNAFIAAFGKV